MRALAACAAALGVEGAEPQAVIDAVAAVDPGHERRLRALFARGEPFVFEIPGGSGGVSVEGRAAGALAWLRLRVTAAMPAGLPGAARLAAFIDARSDPAWIASADGAPVWVNRAWLEAVGSESLEDALAKGLPSTAARRRPGREAADLGRAARNRALGDLASGRRALRIQARPLDGGGVALWTQDITGAEDGGETLKRQAAAHNQTLNHIGDAVAVFGADRRLGFPQHRLRRAVGPGAGLARRAAHPRRGARPPAPAPAPARDRRLRPVQGRRAGRYRGPDAPAGGPMWRLPGRAHPAGGAPAAPPGRPAACCSPTSPPSCA